MDVVQEKHKEKAFIVYPNISSILIQSEAEGNPTILQNGNHTHSKLIL